MEPPHKIVTEYSLPSTGGRALDIGAGTGRDSYYLSKNLGYEVDAVDNASRGMITDDENMLANLSKIAQNEHLSIHVHAMDIRDFIFKDDMYALIIAINSLQFLDDISAMAKNIVGSLTPKGRFICSLVTRTIKIEKGKTINISDIKPRISSQELKSAFSDLRTLLIEERLVHDSPHPGAPDPHIHSIIEFVGEK